MPNASFAPAISTAAALLAAPAWAEDRKAPLIVEAVYVADVLSNVAGGLERGSAWLGRGDLTVTTREGLLGIDGAVAFLDIMAVHGDGFSADEVGDAQTVSNIEADSAIRPIEAWLLVPFDAQGSYAKAGLIDLNTEFDVQEVGAFFLGSSHGIGPEFSQSGRNGPSIFPITSAAAMIGVTRERWAARFAIFDPVAGARNDPERLAIRFPGAEGALLVAEAEWNLGATAEVQAGAWAYTSRFDVIGGTVDANGPGQSRGSRGAYAMLEGRLAGDDRTSLDAWVRAGIANARVNPIRSYFGGGVTYGNDEARIGFAIAHARLGEPARAASAAAGTPADRAETAFELSYAAAIGDNVTVQPDVQYVVNPGWDPSVADALVIGARFIVSLP